MIALEFENVSKKYTLKPRTLKGIFTGLSRNILWRSNNNQTDSADQNDLWALRKVSFKVRKGETIGIIGPNGSGKSTLLKVISGITLPDCGKTAIKGKVCPLLELGVGFHLQFTGRENIYLYGSILGLNKKQIDSKFDSIVNFSELGYFIDTPVDRYSSGMYARLGFSVAAHMEPDILLIDEVLSVGDMRFGRKCIDKILQMKEKQVTIVFVSHSLEMIKGVCDRAIFLNHGGIVVDGNVSDVIEAYQDWANQSTREASYAREITEMLGTGEVEIVKVQFFDDQGKEKDIFKLGEKLIIRAQFDAKKEVKRPVFSLGIIRSDGTLCCGLRTVFDNIVIDQIRGPGSFEVEIERIQLNSGIYTIRVFVLDSSLHNLCSQRFEKILKINAAVPNLGHVFFPIAKWRI